MWKVVLPSARKPWIFVDEVKECVSMQKIITRKHITSSDFFLIGHFPEYSVYPGVLLLEGLLQSACLLYNYSNFTIMGMSEETNVRYPVTSCEVRFIRPAEPGGTLEYTVKFERVMDQVIDCRGIGMCGAETLIRANWKLSLNTDLSATPDQ